MTAASDYHSALAGLHILMVEDEMMLAMSLEDLLNTVQCKVSKAPTVAKALEMAGSEAIDGALLDINLRGDRVYPVAAELERRGIPFAFMTGYGAPEIDPDWRDRPVLQKPFLLDDLEQVMTTALASARQS